MWAELNSSLMTTGFHQYSADQSGDRPHSRSSSQDEGECEQIACQEHRSPGEKAPGLEQVSERKGPLRNRGIDGPQVGVIDAPDDSPSL